MSETTLLQSWLDRLGANDPAAREQLLSHSRERLHRLTHQMLRRYPRLRQFEETSDVLQDVYIRLLRALETEPLATARDYLRVATTIIRRVLIDLTRHHFGPEGDGANLQPNGSDGAPPDPSGHTDDPYQLAQWREVHEAIAALASEDRELFDLVYYQGLPQEEAARLLGVPLRTFKTHWRNARLRLMTRFGGQSPFDSE